MPLASSRAEGSPPAPLPQRARRISMWERALPANSPTANPCLAQAPCGTLRGAIRYNHTKAMKYIAGMIVNNTV